MAQTGSVDSIEIIEPPVVDSFYSDDEEYLEEETYEDSTKRAKANAFDAMDTLAIASVSWRKSDNNFVNSLKNSPDFEYVKTGLSEPKKKSVKHSDIDLGKIWLYIAIVLFLFILVWYLKDNNLLLFRKKQQV
ncbi:hypothetical protein [Niabella ginsengisoli]|uniref:Uncharacterized protein n=1 Tax=Niabella ginsengisoli TaxID=522298 RepID=A0ABS9SMG5_9BACT|nr:hypothetical protein [Niabella ginsengisoli]MCH5599573.1 hypothetical protein [Niabella ginsengisoli]